MTMLELIIVVLILMILCAILLPNIGSTGHRPGQVACASLLRQVALAAMNYAEDHNGTYPASYAEFDGSPPYLKSNSILCVVFDKNQATIGSLGSFVYCAQRLTRDSSNRSVIAYEHQGNHPKAKGINVVYKDGSVQLVDNAVAIKLIADLQAGHNPPRAEMLK